MEKVYEYIQLNVPDATTSEIDYMYKKHNGNLLEMLTELMKITVKEEKPKTEWEKRREICDDYDTEMYKKLHSKST